MKELEQKKPQLDELLHTAESLKGTENRQQLHGKGKFKHIFIYIQRLSGLNVRINIID